MLSLISLAFGLALAQGLPLGDDLPVIGYYQPEQVHLSLGPVDNSMTVTWSTFNETGRYIFIQRVLFSIVFILIKVICVQLYSKKLHGVNSYCDIQLRSE